MVHGNYELKRIKIFLFSFLAGIRVNLVGQLPFSEIFALVHSLNPDTWIRIFRKIPDVKKITIAYGVFFLSQIISDIVNQSDLQNIMRGWANILMAMVLVTFLARMLWKSSSLIIVFFIAEILRLIFFAPSSYGISIHDMGFFKFRLTPILNDLILISSWWLLKKSRVNKIPVVLLLAFYGMFCIAFDFRSNGFLMILTALIMMKIGVLKRIRFKQFALYFALFCLVLQGLYAIYISQVLSGNIGGEHSLEQLRRIENPYNPFNLMKTGRAQTFAALTAIIDKPFFGHGSWAPDPDGKYNKLVFELHNEGDRFPVFFQNNEKIIIPSHSVLFGAWMTSGLGGFIAILFIIFLFFKRSLSLLRNLSILKSPYLAIIIFLFLDGLWAFFFSPLPHIRGSLPLKLAFFFTLYQQQYIKKSLFSLIMQKQIS